MRQIQFALDYDGEIRIELTGKAYDLEDIVEDIERMIAEKYINIELKEI